MRFISPHRLAATILVTVVLVLVPVAGERLLRSALSWLPRPLDSQAMPPGPPASLNDRDSGRGLSPTPDGVVIVASESGQSLTLIQASTNQVTTTVRLDMPLQRITVSPDQRTVWGISAKPDASDVALVDLVTGRVDRRRLRPHPSAIGFSADGSLAFVALDQPAGLAFLDLRDDNGRREVALGRQTAELHLFRQPDALITLGEPGRETVFIAGRGSGIVWVLDATSVQMVTEIDIGGGPFLLLPAPDQRQLYAVVEALDQLVTIDPMARTVIARLDLPDQPVDAAIGPSGQVYLAGATTRSLWAIDPLKQQVRSLLQLSAQPAGIALSPDGSRAYVISQDEPAVIVIDVASASIVEQISLADQPSAVAFAAAAPASSRADEPATASRHAQPGAPAAHPDEGTPADGQLPPGVIKETFLAGAAFPAALAFSPDGRLFYTERLTGRIRIVQDGRLLPDPFYSFAVATQPETGLLGLALDPDFATNHYVYVFYTEGSPDGQAGPNHVVRLTDRHGQGTDLTPILTGLPSGQIHNGGRLRFGPDGKLYVAVGETGRMEYAQDLASPAGKILRINPDGSTPDDNPFAAQDGRHAAIWAYGLRNVFSMDFHPRTGLLFAADNGPGDNDEFNLIAAGGNYGWPPAGFQHKEGSIDPLATLNPVIAPTGLTFYRSDQIPEWTNDLFYCNYHRGNLRRIHLAVETYDRIAAEEVVAPDCTLDVITGPDGALYYSDLEAIYRLRRADAWALPPVSPSPASPTPTPSEPTELRPQDRDLNADLKEWSITLSRTTVPAGRTRFIVTNLGSTSHSLRIEGEDIDVSTANLGPGQTQLLEVELPPGTYQLTCPLPGHTEQGMITSLTVQ